MKEIMSLEETIEKLNIHQAWRKGEIESNPLTPIKLSKVIDSANYHLKKQLSEYLDFNNDPTRI